MAAIHTAKQILRKQMKTLIASLSEEEKIRQSLHVAQKFLRSKEYANCRRISVFLSMHDEVRTEHILKDVFQSQRECFIPRYTSTSMDMVRLHSMEDHDALPETKWKIKQPLLDDPREDALHGGLDVMLIPGLAFTRTGERMGRGKGYYDNYIRRLNDREHRRPLLIALAFSQQLCEHVPTDASDMRIDRVIFEGDEDDSIEK